MSFPLLLQQPGVQLRSWHWGAPSRLLCRTCFLVRQQYQGQLHTKSSLFILGGRNYSSSILGSGGHCRWNSLKQQQQEQYQLHRLQQLYVSSSMSSTRRHLHVTTPMIDARLRELTDLLSHPPSSHRQLSRSASSSILNQQRIYRYKLAALYNSIRRDRDLWHELDSHQLLALYDVLQPPINDPALTSPPTNAQRVLQDLQEWDPDRFGMVHVEALLSTYKSSGQLDDALDLADWANAKHLPLSLTAYEWLIAALTTTTRTTLTRNGQQQRPMDMALHYWHQSQSVIMAGPSEATEAKLELMTGYMMQGFLAQDDVMRAASWLKAHSNLSNAGIQQALNHWKTATSMGGDDRYYAISVVSYGLERLIQQTAHLDRYSDARLCYQRQCRLFSNSNSNNSGDDKTTSVSLQQKQSSVGLIWLADRCITANKETLMQQLLQDALDLGHDKGKKILAHRLLHHWLAKNKLRQALELYFRMDLLEQDFQLPRSFEMVESRHLLLRAAKAKYHTDMYRLYQRFSTLYPSSLDLPTYTRVLQTLIRTKQYDEARVVYQDAVHNPLLLMPTRSSASTVSYTKRLFHLAYSLCAQVGDLDLFKSTVDMQQKAGFPGLHHFALTSLMATYVKIGDTTSAKAVFDHLAHRLEQEPIQQQPIPARPMNSTDDYGDDGDTIDGFDGEQLGEHFDVDVVDFNLLMRTIKVEHDKYQQEHQHQQQVEPIANRILDILRHMNLVGVPLDPTTLRTLLDIYGGQEPMEDEIFTTLLNDPKATRDDEIWLNNLKLTRFILGDDEDNDKSSKIQRSKDASSKFLTNDRQSLFPAAPSGAPILANGLTYKILLDALTQKAELAHIAQRIFDHMRNRGWRPAVVTYEKMVIVWARKQRLQKVLAMMQVACDDLGWTDAPVKWYTAVLDRLVVQKRLDLAQKWTLEIKKRKHLPQDHILNQRLITYNLKDSQHH